ncbi:MAG: rhodanese-like domain-containing protein [Candidatus Methylacidiphilales bacterium]|nr:rhodanese-like domain-containing protein [Candidatus Methylacidiphilales bacterium]
MPTPSCQPDMTMAAIESAFPAARRALFRAFHIGGCSSCGFQPEETLEQVCLRNENLDPARAVETILAAQVEEDRLQCSPLDINARLKKGEAIRLVDIRSREEHEAVHIPGSELLSQELTRQLLDHAGPGAVVFYDHQGKHIMDAVSYFIGHGLKEAYALKGGIDAWAVEVDPSLPRYQIG